MTEEQALAEATQEIEASKPRYKTVNGVSSECTEEDYQFLIENLKNSKLNNYNFGYIENRQMAYLPLSEQLDMMYWDNVNGTTNWQDHIAEVKANNPKPS